MIKNNHRNFDDKKMFSIITLVIGGLLFLLGTGVIIGWHTKNIMLVQILPTSAPMQYNTALGFILIGTGLFLYRKGFFKISMGLGGFLILMGFLTLCEYGFNSNLGIDEMFMKHFIVTKTSTPGRMAPNTAICFILVGIFFLSRLLNKYKFAEFMLKNIVMSLNLGLSITALAGYVLNVETAYGWGYLTKMALHTSIGFILASIGGFSYIFSKGKNIKNISSSERTITTIIIIFSTAISFGQALYFKYIKIEKLVNMDSATPIIVVVLLNLSVLLLFLIFYLIVLNNSNKLLKLNVELKKSNDLLRTDDEMLKTANDLGQKTLEKLRESEEQLELILEGSQLGYWDWNLETNVVYRNEIWANMLGYDLSDLEFTVKQWIDFIHPDDRERAKKSIEDNIEGRTSMHRIEYRMKMKNGEYKWILDRARAVRWDSNQKVIRMCGTHTDITERKQVELELLKVNEQAEKALKELAESQEIFNQFMKHSPIYVYFKDEKIRAVKVSDNFKEMLGIPVEEIIGKTMDEIYPSEFAKKMIDDDRKVLREGNKTEIEEEFGGKTYTSIKFPIQVGNKSTYLAGFTIDITEKKRYEELLQNAKEQAEKANLAKSEFLSNMSHELRTPMNGIIGFTDILLNMETDAEKKEMLNIIFLCSEHLLNLISDVLNLSKIEAGKMEVHPMNTDIKELMVTTEKIFKQQIFNKGLEFLVEYSEPMCDKILIDRTLILQVLNNLISNSIKFTEKGYVKLQIKEFINEKNMVNYIEFSVIDTGIGINELKQKSLYEAFEQGEYYMSKTYGGTGLGLAIVKKLVDLMGGEISVETEIGKGTKIVFSLPYDKVEEASAETKGNKLTFSKKIKILSAEDDEVSVMLLKRIVEKEGWDLKTVENGEKLIEELERENYDLVLMDIQMPVMNGIEATKIIRENKRYGKLKIIAVSAFALEENIEKVMATGVDGYLTKPLNVEKMREIVFSLVEASSKG